jgi:hypothetical protein
LAPTASKVLKASSTSCYISTRERKKKKERTYSSTLGYVTPHLVSLFLAPLFPALLVGKGVPAQTPLVAKTPPIAVAPPTITPTSKTPVIASPTKEIQELKANKK